MDLERLKQLRNEYAEQHIISREQFEKLNELLYNNGVVPEPPQEDRPPMSEAMEVYEIKKDGMTRQERRAYLRRLAKENKRKH